MSNDKRGKINKMSSYFNVTDADSDSDSSFVGDEGLFGFVVDAKTRSSNMEELRYDDSSDVSETYDKALFFETFGSSFGSEEVDTSCFNDDEPVIEKRKEYGGDHPTFGMCKIEVDEYYRKEKEKVDLERIKMENCIKRRLASVQRDLYVVEKKELHIDNFGDIEDNFIDPFLQNKEIDEESKEKVKEIENVREPVVMDQDTKSFCWSDTEWYDLKNVIPRSPSVVFPIWYPQQENDYDIYDIKKCRYGQKPFFLKNVGRVRKDNGVGGLYGMARVGDVLFKFLGPLMYESDQKGDTLVTVSSKSVYSVMNKRGLNGYVMLPHDRLFSCESCFDSKGEYRIACDLDIDLINRSPLFSKVRMTQFFVHLYFRSEGEKVLFGFIEKNKEWVQADISYVELDRNGLYEFMMDVNDPPFWNRRMSYDIVFKGEAGNKCVAGGYIKFWLTYLVAGTKLVYSSIAKKVSRDLSYSTNYCPVINPVNKEGGKYLVEDFYNVSAKITLCRLVLEAMDRDRFEIYQEKMGNAKLINSWHKFLRCRYKIGSDLIFE
jgi:hypothetical protein